MILTLDREAHLSNLMIAYKRSDLQVYLRELEACKSWMDSYLFDFYFNLSKSSIFARKGYFKQ